MWEALASGRTGWAAGAALAVSRRPRPLPGFLVSEAGVSLACRLRAVVVPCAVDLPFPENATRPLLSGGPSAVALYRGHRSSLAPGKALPVTGLLDAFVYTSDKDPNPELLETLTPGRPAYQEQR